MNKETERTHIIKSLTEYKIFLKNGEKNRLKKLFKYYHEENVRDENSNSNQSNGHYKIKEELKDIKYISYDNPYEAYLITQIKIGKALPPILDEHITRLEEGEDLGWVIKSLEYGIYRVKKNVYTDINEWEAILKYIPEDRLFEIKENPKGPGDLIIKELSWIKEYEERLQGC